MESVLGKVVAIGFSFFDKSGQPHTAFPTPEISGKEIMSALFSAGIFNLEVAWRVEAGTGDEVRTVEVSPFHTRRTLGSTPQFKIGDAVEVVKVPHHKEPEKLVLVLKPAASCVEKQKTAEVA